MNQAVIERPETPRSHYDRMTQALEWPMAILALAVIPALLIDSGTATPRRKCM
jgi:hypothetical protein